MPCPTARCCSRPPTGSTRTSRTGSSWSAGRRSHAPSAPSCAVPGLRVEVVSEGGQWPDPSHVASAVHPPHALRLGGPTTPDDDHGWGESWRVARPGHRGSRRAHPFPWPSGLGVASALVDALPGDAVLVLGSSNPVRDVDLAVAGPIADEVLANRGLAGIDGVVSTAVGVALAPSRRRRPTPCSATSPSCTTPTACSSAPTSRRPTSPSSSSTTTAAASSPPSSTALPSAPQTSSASSAPPPEPTWRHCAGHTASGTTCSTTRAELTAAVAEAPHGIRVLEVVVDRATHRQAHADLRALAARPSPTDRGSPTDRAEPGRTKVGDPQGIEAVEGPISARR